MAKPHIKLKHAKVETPKAPAEPPADPVVAHLDSIVAHWAAGDTFATIVKSLRIPLTAPELKKRIVYDDELREKLNAVHVARAFALIDKATEAADNAVEAAGPLNPSGFAAGAKVYLALAEKLDRATWGNVKSVEHSGPGGGPIQTKADMTLSPADAYERMVKGS